MNYLEKQQHEELIAHLEKAHTHLLSAQNEMADFIRKTHEFDLWHSVRQDIKDQQMEALKAGVHVDSTKKYMIREGG